MLYFSSVAYDTYLYDIYIADKDEDEDEDERWEGGSNKMIK